MLSILNHDMHSIEDSNFCYLNGPVDNDASDYVIRFLIERNYPQLGKDKPTHIRLVINSPGGNLPDGMAIIDAIRASDIPVHTYALGEVCSAGFMIFMSGCPGHRYCFKNTSLMSHQWSVDGESGKEHEVMASAIEYKNIHNRINVLYMECTGLDKKAIEENLLPPTNVWLTPKQALKWKICDKIVTKFQ